LYTNDDGVVGEILLEDKVISKKNYELSEIVNNENNLKELQEKNGQIYIVWYDK
jgi:hypothetical protein